MWVIILTKFTDVIEDDEKLRMISDISCLAEAIQNEQNEIHRIDGSIIDPLSCVWHYALNK